MSKKWQKFESLVAHIQSTFAPEAKITPNEKIRGKRSKTLRQIDIAVRQKIGQYEVFIAVDCKDYRRRVNVKDVEEFIGLAEDVDANKGAIVSASGFSKAAKTRAEDAGINVYRLVDAEKHDWQTYVTIPILCDFRNIKSFSFTLRGTGLVRIGPQDFRTMLLFNNNGKPIDGALNMLLKKWNSGLLSNETGEHKDIKLTDDTTFIKTENQFYQVEVTANIIVEKTLYFGQLPLTEVKGFQDQINGTLITTRFETEVLDVLEVQRNWQKLKSEEELAIKPVLLLVASNSYPYIKH